MSAKIQIGENHCLCCGGAGEIDLGHILRPREAMNKLYDIGWLDNVSFRGRVKMMKDLEKRGSSVCPACKGTGKRAASK